MKVNEVHDNNMGTYPKRSVINCDVAFRPI